MIEMGRVEGGREVGGEEREKRKIEYEELKDDE